MKTTIIEGKTYTVEHVFNMVGNWYFTDKDGNAYLVDAEDVIDWWADEGKKWAGIDTAIDYAKTLAQNNDGVFYWTVKPAV